ncbi:hypothetical protein V1478_010671 [Vespula squamosa]|uniref:Maturase K n=1 Tax=Vespula squamosa TaxID=30214 RepID=A0ABD2AIP6_VESSQ
MVIRKLFHNWILRNKQYKHFLVQCLLFYYHNYKLNELLLLLNISKNIEPILIALLLNTLNLLSLESLYTPYGKHVKKTLLEKHCITFICPGAIKTGNKDVYFSCITWTYELLLLKLCLYYHSQVNARISNFKYNGSNSAIERNPSSKLSISTLSTYNSSQPSIL